MRRDVPWDRIVREVVPFLVTRQIFAGAGKMGIEGEDSAGQPGVFQIAQRSDFFSVLCSIDTMNRRPLVNTRDEPHADAELYRRFHVIIGDANMSQLATALKIGTTALVLELIETGPRAAARAGEPDRGDEGDQPRRELSRGSWSCAMGGRFPRSTSSGSTSRRRSEHCDERTSDTRVAAARMGARCSTISQRDYWRCRDRLDWVAKKFLLTTFQEAEAARMERSVAAIDRPRIPQRLARARALLRAGAQAADAAHGRARTRSGRRSSSRRTRRAPFSAAARWRSSIARSSRSSGTRSPFA